MSSSGTLELAAKAKNNIDTSCLVHLFAFKYVIFDKTGHIMIIERDNENLVVIKVDPSLVGLDEIQRTINYFRILESNAKNQGTQEQTDELAREVNKEWWAANKNRFLK